MIKLCAAVTLCGLYAGHVDACLTLSERQCQATRGDCIKRGQALMKTAKTAAWYGGIKEPHTAKIKCAEVTRR